MTTSEELLPPAAQLSRRDLLKGFGAIVGGGLLAMIPSPAGAQESSTTPDPEIQAKIRNLDAQAEAFQADARNKDADTENRQSWHSTVGDVALPLTAAATLISAGAGGAVAWHGHRREKLADTKAIERAAHDQSLATHDRILTELAKPDEEVRKLASTQLVNLAKSERLTDQLAVFDITRSLLWDRQTGDADPRRFSTFEKNVINAFLAVLPAVRQSGQRSAPFDMGMEHWPEPVLDCKGVNLSGVDLSGHDLRNVDFTHGRFQNTLFQRCVLNHTIFNGADLRGAMFLFMEGTPDTDFRRVLLQGADMRDTSVRTRFLESPSFYEQIDEYAARIEGLILLGDRRDATALPDSKIDHLVAKGARYLPRNKDALGNVDPHYRTERTRVRVKPITDAENTNP